jgi:hypothetical protein
MKNTLITIDSYLSAEDRADACRNLIKQIREVFGNEYEILLINKSNKDFGLQKEVDYYYNLSNSFMVGYPPEEILAIERYERPYVYVGTGVGTCENWLPLTGVTDHVAGIYNSFIISTKISEMMGYSHVFKVEYDTIFDMDELRDIKNDLEKGKDYIFYGVRKMGEYAKKHHYLIDVHIAAYSNKIFEGFDVVKNDDDFWKLNEKINYYGKWIEYVIPSVFEHQKLNNEYEGIEYEGFLRGKYPKSEFDIINGAGEWTEKWKNMPKVCFIKNDNDEDNFNFGLFYWNEDHNEMKIETVVEDEEGNVVYNSNLNLKHKFFNFDKVTLNEHTFTIKKKNTINGITEEYTEILTKESVTNSNVHFKLNK